MRNCMTAVYHFIFRYIAAYQRAVIDAHSKKIQVTFVRSGHCTVYNRINYHIHITADKFNEGTI